MINYFNYHLKGAFTPKVITSWASYLKEQPEAVLAMIDIVVPLMSIAIIFKIQKSFLLEAAEEFELNPYDLSIEVKKNEALLKEIDEGVLINQWEFLDNQRMDYLFEQRFHSVVDKIGAYLAVKSKSVNQLFNILWPKVYFGIGLSLETVAYKKNPEKKLEKDFLYFRSKLPTDLNIDYLLGIPYTKNKTRINKFALLILVLIVFVISYLCLL